MKKIKILCLTGTRADYPRVKSVLTKIKKDKKSGEIVSLDAFRDKK